MSETDIERWHRFYMMGLEQRRLENQAKIYAGTDYYSSDERKILLKHAKEQWKKLQENK